MKRTIAFFLIFALLCTACGAAAQPDAAASAVDVTPTAVSAASASDAAALNDPTDAAKEATEDFSIICEKVLRRCG